MRPALCSNGVDTEHSCILVSEYLVFMIDFVYQESFTNDERNIAQANNVATSSRYPHCKFLGIGKSYFSAFRTISYLSSCNIRRIPKFHGRIVVADYPFGKCVRVPPARSLRGTRTHSPT